MNTLQPGSRLDHYTLHGLLRADSHRAVWVAGEGITNRIVNVHVCLEQTEYHRIRFERAMSILSRLDHAAFARYIGSGSIDGSPYLVTEHVNGPTLEELTAQGGRMQELHALKIANQIADGFDQAWTRAGVIHRDLKPSSILVDVLAMRENSGNIEVKVTDFGQALGQRLVDQFEHDLAAEEADFQRVTRSERVGSLICMSPEQIRGKELSAASDMYALGVTLFLLLAGRPPFVGSDEELRTQHVSAAPPELPADISANMRAIVKRLLSKLPDRRYDSWADLRNQTAALLKRLEHRPAPRPTSEGPTTEIRYKRSTQRFERTPLGQPVVENRFETPVSSERSSQASIDSLVQMLNRLALAMPATSSQVPIQHAPQAAPQNFAAPASTISQQASGQIQASVPIQATGQTQIPSSLAPGQSPPATTLTSEQLNTLWSYLFHRIEAQPAGFSTPLPETPVHDLKGRQAAAAVVTLPPAYSPSASPQSEMAPTPVHIPEPTPLRVRRIPASDGPGTAREAKAATTAPGTAREAKETTAAAAPAAQVAAPDQPQPPAEAPWSVRQAVIEALSLPLLHPSHGTSIAKPESLTSRFTHRIKRMLGDRNVTTLAIDRALRSSAFAEASRLIDSLAETAGNDGPLCVLRSRLAGLRGDYGNMIDWAQRAIMQKHDEPLALAIVAFGNLCLGQDNVAEVICRNLADDHPASPFGSLCLAAVTLANERTDEAAEQLTVAKERDPEHRSLILLTAAWWRFGNDVASETTTLQLYRELYGDTPAITARLSALGCA